MSTQKPSAKLPKAYKKVKFGDTMKAGDVWLWSNGDLVNCMSGIGKPLKPRDVGSDVILIRRKKLFHTITVSKPAKSRPVAKPATNDAKIERALAMSTESRPRMNELTREQRTELEASARASIAAKKSPAVTPAKTIKARIMWGSKKYMASHEEFMVHDLACVPRVPDLTRILAVLDVTDEAALIEQIAKDIHADYNKNEGLTGAENAFDGLAEYQRNLYRQFATSSFVSLGVIAKRKSK